MHINYRIEYDWELSCPYAINNSACVDLFKSILFSYMKYNFPFVLPLYSWILLIQEKYIFDISD